VLRDVITPDGRIEFRRGLSFECDRARSHPMRNVCPGCSKINASPTAKFCAACGRSLLTADKHAGDAELRDESCPACGTAVNAEAVTCPSCGLTLVLEGSPEAAVAERSLEEPRSQATDESPPEYGSVDACPACGETLRGDEAACPGCGLVLDTAED
jgi:uncharacterized Zn finger protein (UPF0148 family)